MRRLLSPPKTLAILFSPSLFTFFLPRVDERTSSRIGSYQGEKSENPRCVDRIRESNLRGGFGSKRVKIDMAPLTGKAPLILRSVVPAIPKELGERAYLEEDLTRIGCIGLLNKP